MCSDIKFPSPGGLTVTVGAAAIVCQHGGGGASGRVVTCLLPAGEPVPVRMMAADCEAWLNSNPVGERRLWCSGTPAVRTGFTVPLLLMESNQDPLKGMKNQTEL